MYQVKDAMNRNVISICPEATVEEAIHLLLDHSISGAPVIDDEGELCGIVTQFQLLEVMYDPNVKNTRIRDCMTRGVFTIDEDAMGKNEHPFAKTLHQFSRGIEFENWGKGQHLSGCPIQATVLTATFTYPNGFAILVDFDGTQ